jgi:ribonucleoside-diphosphate reductase alpha chain
MVLLQSYSFSENDFEQLKNFFDDITIKTFNDILKDINYYGYESTYTRYGNDYSDYEYQLIAGRMVYFILMKICPNIEIFLKNFQNRLKSNVYDSIERNKNVLEPLLNELELKMIKNVSWCSVGSWINTYLTRDRYGGNIIETPVQLLMRNGFGIFQDDEQKAIEYVSKACELSFCMASPVLFGAGLEGKNMASCFLLSAGDDTESIFDNLKKCAKISKKMGGVGMDISYIRHSAIGLDGRSKGLLPLLQVTDLIMKWFDQTGKRPGAATLSCQAHHIDMYDFIDCVKKTGDKHTTVDKLNVCIVFPNLFWKRWNADEEKGENSNWTMFCPAQTPGLNEAMGEEYDKLYEKYENDPTVEAKKTVNAKEFLLRVVSMQRQTGMPYIVHKDTVNYKCNQYNSTSERHNEIIKGPNLCLEIFERSNKEETGVCNLSQISLPYFVKDHYENEENIMNSYDFIKLGETARYLIRVLNKVIDFNCYPVESAKVSNERHRPVGLGVSGYSDALALMDLAYDDPKVNYINKVIFACIYFNALVESCRLSIEEGPYEYFQGSPISEGKFQFDLWKDEREELDRLGYLRKFLRPEEDDKPIPVDVFTGGKYPVISTPNSTYIISSWDVLRKVIIEVGVRNSMLIALMPSASTSRILENAETVEPHQSNLYTRIFVKDTFPIINRHCYRDLKENGLWNDYTVQFLLTENGSLRLLDRFIKDNLNDYPNFNGDYDKVKHLMNKYKTSFEISSKLVAIQNAQRGRYICQSQSSNIFMADPTTEQLETAHFVTWALGAKTGMYYLRQKPAGDMPKVSLLPEIKEWHSRVISELEMKRIENSTEQPTECVFCT